MTHRFGLAAFFILSAVGPAVQSGPLEAVVASIEGRPIVHWEIDYTASKYGGQGGAEAWLRILARDRLGALKAEAIDLEDATADLKWRLWAVEKKTGVDAFLADMTRQVSVPEEAVREAYENDIERFRRPATFSFHYIFCETTEVGSPADLERVRLDLGDAHRELMARAGAEGASRAVVELEDFQAVAEKCPCSKGATVQFAGPFRLEEPIQRIIKETALSLSPGEAAEPISTKYGLQLLRLHEKTEETTLPYEAARDLIRRELEAPLRQEVVDAYIESLRQDESRYVIHRVRLRHQLPGAHHSTPESPYVLEVGDEKWAPDDFKAFMRGVHREDWMMSFHLEKAYNTTVEKIVLPTLIHQDADKAGFVEQATAQAERRVLRDQLLAHYWVQHTAFRKLADLPSPATEDYRAFFDANPQEYSIPAHVRFRIFDLPVETTGEAASPAEIEFRFRSAEGKMASLLSRAVDEASPSQLVEAWRERLPGLSETTEWLPVRMGLAPEVWDWADEGGEGWYEKPIRTPNGVRIVQAIDRREASMKPFDPTHIGLRASFKNHRERAMIQETWRELEEEAWSKLERPNL